PHDLWAELPRGISAGRCLRGSHPQRRPSGRPTGRAGPEVRVRPQCPDRARPRGESPAIPRCARRRGRAVKAEAVLRAAYAAFNARDVARALALMTPDVICPNGMEGGAPRAHPAG